eukprot:3208249-Heterocapsa_arctica.AAC.1
MQLGNQTGAPLSAEEAANCCPFMITYFAHLPTNNKLSLEAQGEVDNLMALLASRAASMNAAAAAYLAAS